MQPRVLGPADQLIRGVQPWELAAGGGHTLGPHTARHACRPLPYPTLTGAARAGAVRQRRPHPLHGLQRRPDQRDQRGGVAAARRAAPQPRRCRKKSSVNSRY